MQNINNNTGIEEKGRGERGEGKHWKQGFLWSYFIHYNSMRQVDSGERRGGVWTIDMRVGIPRWMPLLLGYQLNPSFSLLSLISHYWTSLSSFPFFPHLTFFKTNQLLPRILNHWYALLGSPVAFVAQFGHLGHYFPVQGSPSKLQKTTLEA